MIGEKTAELIRRKELTESSNLMASPVLSLTLRVNGKTHSLPALDPRTTLLDALREHLKLTGTKKGCDLGQCGACTVLAGDRRIKACLALAALYDGREITTIEGVTPDGGVELHPLQRAFIEHDAFQCGYCTPGQIMSAIGLLSEGRARSTDEIREFMSGNLCRCGAYANIVTAIAEVAQRSVERVASSPATKGS
jgi:xanthine dehydrogenase YagT iron-sulfur-binding subunit